MRQKILKVGRHEMAEWLETFRFTHFVTLAFNPNNARAVSTEYSLLSGGSQRAMKRLREWEACVNRRALGGRWSKRVDERMCAAAFLEHPHTNAHWHLLALPPVTSDPNEVAHIMTAEWKKLEQNGTVKVEPIYDTKKLSRYVAKELENPECWERFEFLGPKIS